MNRIYEISMVLTLSLFCVFIQGSVLGLLLPSFVIPDLLIVLIVYLAFFEAGAWGAVLVFFAGIILDLSTGLLLGPWAASYVVVYAILTSLSQHIFVNSFLAAFLSVFASRIIASSVYFLIVKGFLAGASGDISISLSHALVSGLCAPILLSSYKKIFARVHSDRASAAYGSS